MVEASTKPLILDSAAALVIAPSIWLLGFLMRRLLASIICPPLRRYRDSNSHTCMVVKADVNDFWRLAMESGWRPIRHYLLYPNPYPKASQLRKRWYGSPAFHRCWHWVGLTVRSNWSYTSRSLVWRLKSQAIDLNTRRSTDSRIAALKQSISGDIN